jgi:putative ABC transport system permease protein
MLGLALRNFGARKFRAISTALAVFFGVAMVAGTLLITESVNRSFDNLFTEINSEIDVTVREQEVVEDPFGAGPLAGFEDSIVEKVSKVEGVEVAEGVIGDIKISILGDDGERIGPEAGPPHIAISVTQDERFSPLTVLEGAYPDTDGEVAIDIDSAETAGFEIGETIRITGAAGASEYEIVGITQFGSGNAPLGASLALFTLDEAQRLTDKEGRFDEIDIAASEGTPPEVLARRVADSVGPKFAVRTGEQTATEDAGDITDGFSFLTVSLLVFAGISVFVGGFLIFNTFSITVAQRTREFAMLRTLGASSRQVLVAVLLEAALIGLLASTLGIAGGFGFVELVKVMFKAGGFELPVTSLRLDAVSIGIPIAVGMLSTIVAALMPALRATRVAPLEALRESGGSTEVAQRTSRRRSVIAALLTLAGAGLIALGLFVNQAVEPALAQMGGGLVLLFIGIAMLGGRFVPPIVSAIGAPIQYLRGVTGRLARENAQRQPSRTATTAAALMIGVALIVFVGVFSSSLSASIDDSIDRQFAGDLTVLNVDGFSPIPAGVSDELAEVEGVGVVSPTSLLAVRVDETDSADEETYVAGFEPAEASQVFAFDWEEGSDETLSTLATDEAIAEAGWAEENGVAVGDELTLTGPAGDKQPVTVTGTLNDPTGILVEALAIPRATAQDPLGARDDATVVLAYAEGADPGQTRDEIETLLSDRFPNTEARDQDEIKQDAADQLNQLVTLIYVLLGLSVIVSIFGVVNTLALTILERTRELGMLRAIGTSRSQVRRMVRYESVINALLGTVVGTVIGLGLATAAVSALEEDGLVLSIPLALPIVVLGAAILLGVLAAIRPARRASRLDVIESLQYE